MIRFVLNRLGSGVIVLLFVAAMTFTLLFLSADTVARNLLGEEATAGQVAKKEAELGLDQPFLVRLFEWFRGAITGDFGTSWFTQISVSESILSRLPATLSVVLVATFIAAILATVLGLAAAVYHRGWLDRGLQVVSIGAAAVPQFVVAIVLVTILAIHFQLFPATGFVKLEDDFGGWMMSITLPVAALIIGMVASTAQQVRSATINERGKDFVRTLRSRGLPPREILFRHVLRGAAPAGLTILSVHFVNIISGVVIIETIFALPGLGYLALQSTVLGDMPVLMGVVCYIVVIVILVNLLVDLAVGWINPKARVS